MLFEPESNSELGKAIASPSAAKSDVGHNKLPPGLVPKARGPLYSLNKLLSRTYEIAPPAQGAFRLSLRGEGCASTMRMRCFTRADDLSEGSIPSDEDAAV